MELSQFLDPEGHPELDVEDRQTNLAKLNTVPMDLIRWPNILHSRRISRQVKEQQIGRKMITIHDSASERTNLVWLV